MRVLSEIHLRLLEAPRNELVREGEDPDYAALRAAADELVELGLMTVCRVWRDGQYETSRYIETVRGRREAQLQRVVAVFR